MRKSVIICIICKQDSFDKIKKIINKNIEKHLGPRTDPCGTPLLVVCHELYFSPTRTRCCLLERYDQIILDYLAEHHRLPAMPPADREAYSLTLCLDPLE